MPGWLTDHFLVLFLTFNPERQSALNGRLASLVSNPLALVTIPTLELWAKKWVNLTPFTIVHSILLV